MAHYKAMLRVMEYVYSTKEMGLMIRPNREMRWPGDDVVIRGRSDSDYASFIEKRISVTGFVVYWEGVPVVVRSVMQKRIALSVTEAELYAIVSCIQDMLFVNLIMKSINIKVNLPMVVESDNAGAVELVNGWSVSHNSRHIGVRLNFVRGLKEAGKLKIDRCEGVDNEADLCTKNVSSMLYTKFSNRLVTMSKSNPKATEGIE